MSFEGINRNHGTSTFETKGSSVGQQVGIQNVHGDTNHYHGGSRSTYRRE